MFQKNDLVLYRTEGIYKVEDVCVPDISGADDRLYYVMHSLSTNTTAYTPVDADVSMRKVITRAEALSALSELPEMDCVDLSKKTHKHLKDYYVKTIKDQEFTSLLSLYKSIMTKKDSLEQNNKKLCQTDITYMRKTTKLLHEEIAISLGITEEEADVYLEQSLVSTLN